MIKVRLGDLKFKNGYTIDEYAIHCLRGDCKNCEMKDTVECHLLPDFQYDDDDYDRDLLNYEFEIPQTAIAHGKWYTSKPQDGKQRGLCSECGHVVTMAAGKLLNYCPQCGAEMDRAESEDEA